MTRVLLCCEGVNDFGRSSFDGEEWSSSDGVVQAIIRKILPNINWDFVPKSRKNISDFKIQRKTKSKKEKRALQLAALAKKENCYHIVYHRDEDNKGFEAIYEEVEALFEIARAKEYHCIALVPMHMTESWLLADKSAFEKVYSRQPSVPSLPAKPEEIWGEKGTDKHPKKYMEKVLKQFNANSCTEIYVEIAQNCDLDVLRQKCPVSFGRFCKAIAAFI